MGTDILVVAHSDIKVLSQARSRWVLTIPSTVVYLAFYLNLQFNRCTGTCKNIDFLLLTRVSIFYLIDLLKRVLQNSRMIFNA